MMVAMPLMFPLFGLIFGTYACFFSKDRLPTYYDENKISAYSDGMFRMNLPGVYFNNSNWKYIIGWLRVWSILVMLAGPVVWFVACKCFESMDWVAVYTGSSVVTGVGILISIFIPTYYVAKKYE